jgi:signal transduction histidine kinase/CheY-like chemotaxis protein
MRRLFEKLSYTNLAITLVVVGTVAVTALTYIERKRDRTLEAEAKLSALRAFGEVQLVSTALRLLSIGALIENRDGTSPEAFAEIFDITALSVAAVPERAVAFIPEILPENHASFQAEMERLEPLYRAAGYPAFERFPAAPGDADRVWMPVTLVGPAASRPGVFGFDIASDAFRLAAAQAALEVGLPQVTPPIVLSQDDGEERRGSFLMVVPVTLMTPWAGATRAVLAAGMTPQQMFAAAPAMNGPFDYRVVIGDPDTGLPVTLPGQDGTFSGLPTVPLFTRVALEPITIPGATIPLYASVSLKPNWVDVYFVLGPPVFVLALASLILIFIRRIQAQRDAFADELVTRTDELRESERAAARAQRLQSLGRVVGGVAHDFNNNLSVILGNLELALDSGELDQTQRGLVKDAIAATTRGAALTRQLLAFGRRSHLQPTDVALRPALTEIGAVLRRLLPETIAIDVTVPDNLWPARIDRPGLENAVLNVALNAMAAMPNGGVLTIEATNAQQAQPALVPPLNDEIPAGRFILLTIRDTGTGMSEEVFNRAFEPFFSTKGPTEGSGLGLSSVHGFIRQSSGAVKIYSKQGSGTTVQLYIPAAPGAAEPVPAREQPAPFAAQKAQILLVEDEDLLRKVLTSRLEKAGYGVTNCATGDEALMLLQTGFKPDLLISDIVMPGRIQGIALAESARQIDAGIDIILISGYPQEAATLGDASVQRETILTKPVSAADLMRAITEKLGIGG